jgi:broad specificity phosphatase PhoE
MFNLWDEWHSGRLKDTDLTPTELSFVSSIADKFDGKLVDPVLSHFGVAQCLAAQPLINQLSIRYVLVSPLHRTLETARLLFEKHPKRTTIEFIVLPIIREVLANPDDIPAFTIARQKERYTTLTDLHYKFDLVEGGEAFYLETMDSEVQEELGARLKREGTQHYVEASLDVMRQRWLTRGKHKKKLESFLNGRKRCHTFAQWAVNEFAKEKGVALSEVMIVTHSVFLRQLVSQEFNEYGKGMCVQIKNADPFLFNLNSIIPLDC